MGNLSVEQALARYYDRSTEALLSCFSFADIPDAGEQRLLMIEQSLERSCDVSGEPLAARPGEQWVTISSRSGELTSVLLRDTIEGADDYIKRWNHHVTPIEYEDFPQIRDRYLARFAVSHPGQVEITENEVRVTPGQRRLSVLSETEVAIGFAIFNEGASEWRGANLAPEFYPLFVSPNLSGSMIQSPLQWAIERVKLVAGSVIPFVGRDYPLCAIEEPFIQLAPYAGNLSPWRSNEPIIFQRTAEVDHLLKQLPVGISPEAIGFMLSLPVTAAHALLERPATGEFFERLPEYLDRGLEMERVLELSRAVASEPIDVWAVEHALAVAGAVFSSARSERPWWFHESRSLVPEQRSDAWATQVNLEQHRELALCSGAVYQYAAEVWERRGSELIDIEGVPPSVAVDFVTLVTGDYGIGNVSRACNVIDFALAALRELPASERGGCIRDLSELLHEKRPASALVAALEGEDAHFYKPGILHLLVNISKTLPEGDLYHLTVTAEHLAEAVRLTSRPLEERALIESHLRYRPTNRQLITDLKQSGALRLPVPEEFRLSGPTSTPINRWIQFDRMVAREIEAPSRRASVADLYLGMYAHKFPDPLNPPAGFLTLLSRFDSIRDPNWRFPAVEHPDDRAERSAMNERSNVDRKQIVSSLIDTAIVGLISWQDLTNLLEWMVVEIRTKTSSPAKEREEFEIDSSWDEHSAMMHAGYGYQSALADYDQDLIEQLTQLQEDLWSWQERAHETGDARCLERIARIQNRICEIDGRRENLEADFKNYLSGGFGEFGQVSMSQEQREQERLLWDTERRESEISSRIDEMAAERITRMGGAIRVLRLAHSIVAAGVIPHTQFAPMIQTLLAGVRENRFSFLPQATESVIDGKRFSDLLRMMKEIGVVDVERLFAHEGKTLSDSEVAHTITTIWNVATAFDEAISIIGNAAGSRFPSQRLTYQSLDSKVRRSLKEVAPYLEGEGSTQAIIQAYDWMTRYQIVGPYVRALSGPLLESASRLLAQQESGAAPPNRAMVASSNTITNTWLFVEASKKFHQLGSAPFLEYAPEIKIRQAADDDSAGGAFESENERQPGEKNAHLVIPAADDQIVTKFAEFREWLIEQRRADFGKLPLGGKIHVLHWIDENRLQVLKQAFGLGATSFKVENASQSLILPPMASATEIREIANFLSYEKIVDWEFPEIQMCIASRLSPADCAILGASVILASEALVIYDRESFAVSQAHNNHVGYRIMMYDDGGGRDRFPFDVQRGGRTDMQGRKRISDFVIYQTLGSVLAYAAETPHNHPILREQEIFEFREIADWYRTTFRQVLSRNAGLDRVLDELWVNPPELAKGAETGSKGKGRLFTGAIQPLTEAYQRSVEIVDSNGEVGGLLGEVERLTVELTNRVSFVQARMLEHPHYRAQRQQIFSL